ncbi:DUF1257 domain-containing protein [Syntrophomonas palmitatica]|uniref:DUF1257 domain-containing protein n=1 Tax=Syntrophomonas palmitatica TaxID=402877 RepID=UPI00155D99BD|nr:DUF1257 domain-containing protein [Syntrophomonas palmitatica]
MQNTKIISKTAAIKAATKLGYQCRHRAKCRGYNGQTQQCDLVVVLPGGYDLGLNKQPDGSYGLVADFWSDYISKYLADPETLQKAYDMYSELCKTQGYEAAEAMLNAAKISKFKQACNLYETMELAQQQGYYVVQHELPDGSIRLELQDGNENTKKILVDLPSTGEMKVEAEGYSGSSCQEATKFLESLGTVQSTLKPEYYEPQKEGVRNSV